MISKFGQFSMWDTLVRLMPGLKNEMEKRLDRGVDPVLAKSLYSIWRNSSEKTSCDKSLKKPVTLSRMEVDRLKEADLIIPLGDELKITAKGEKIIKIMIL